VRAAFWVGSAAFAATLLISLQIVFLRVGLRRRERGSDATIAKWRPVVTAVAAGVPPASVPALERAEYIAFFKLWLHFHVSLRGNAADSLNGLAATLGCGQIARTMLDAGDRSQQLLAILVLGRMRDREAYPLLRRFAAHRARTLSMHASWALVQIDPAQAAEGMAPDLIINGEWPVREIVTVLQQARTECEPVLLAMAERAQPAHLPRLMQVIEGLRIALPAPLVTRLLADSDPEILISVLRCVGDPAVREGVLPLLRHSDWRVRLQAARTLGRIGGREDLPALAGLLNDSQWWVRYRTAQAIAGLPFLAPGELAAVAANTGDRYASDILRQVMAEGKA
jgi:hypothetical protein